MSTRISPTYLKQLRNLHNKSKTFGRGIKKLNIFDGRMLDLMKNSSRVLDYGCGKGGLVTYMEQVFNKKITGYDPAIKEYSSNPTGQFDFIHCTDVLEHVEPHYVSKVLNHINKLSCGYIYLSICCSPSRKALIDGRNAHLTIRPQKWWQHKIQDYLDIQLIEDVYLIKDLKKVANINSKHQLLISANYHILARKIK